MFGTLVDFQKNKAVSIFCSPLIVVMGMCIFCNLTNSGLLTIGKHYTLTGSSAFLHFKASEPQHIGTAYTEMHHKSKKALVNQGLSANF